MLALGPNALARLWRVAILMPMLAACGERPVAAGTVDGGFSDSGSTKPPASAKIVCPELKVTTFDFSTLPACMALVEKLRTCCSNVGFVNVYTFQVLLHGCDPARRPTEEECRRLLTSAQIEFQCSELRRQPTCNLPPRPCFGGSFTTGGGRCTLEWYCKGAGFTLNCQGDPGKSTCECIKDDEPSGTFTSTDVCSVGPELAIVRANEGCGWDMAIPGYN